MLTHKNEKVILIGSFEEGSFINGKVQIGEALYEGQIKDNYLQGKGVLIFKNSLQLEASFFQNKINKNMPVMIVNLDSGEELRIQSIKEKQNYLRDEKGVGYHIDYHKGVLKNVK